MLEDKCSFNDGIAEIYTLDNAAEKGDKPTDKLVNKRVVRFEYRTVGAVRFFVAKQSDVKIDCMIAIPKGVHISPQDVVILISEGEEQYKIEQVQHKTDTKPHTTLISLQRLVSKYDIA